MSPGSTTRGPVLGVSCPASSEQAGMVGFEGWAMAVTDVIEDKLGPKNVQTELYEDHAIWTSRVNRGVARPDDDGLKVTVLFDHGRGHSYVLAAGPIDAGAEVVGRLLGLG
jgi:hypothetical protein